MTLIIIATLQSTKSIHRHNKCQGYEHRNR